MSANAYTVGDHIVFDAGRYDPGTPSGHLLLAHELGHVVQQSRGGSIPDPRPGNPLENSADQAASGAILGGQVPVAVEGSSARGIARQAKSLESTVDPRTLSDQELEHETRLVTEWLSQHAGNDPQSDHMMQALNELEAEFQRRQATPQQRPPAAAPKQEAPKQEGEAAPADLGWFSEALVSTLSAPAAALGTTAYGLVHSTWHGFVAEIKNGAADAAAKIKGRLREFATSPSEPLSFFPKYWWGLLKGISSPITGLFDLVIFGAKLEVISDQLLASAWTRREELAADANSLAATMRSMGSKAKAALSAMFSRPIDTVAALGPLLDKAQQEANAAAEKGGHQIGATLLQATDQPIPDLAETAGEVIGTVVVNVVLFIFTDGIGDAIAQAAKGLGEFASVLSKLGEGAELLGGIVAKLSEVLATVGGWVAKAEEFIASAASTVLKPLEPVLKEFGEAMSGLRNFLRDLLGVAEKSGGEELAAASKIAGGAHEGPRPTLGGAESHPPPSAHAPQPHAAPTPPPEPHTGAGAADVTHPSGTGAPSPTPSTPTPEPHSGASAATAHPTTPAAETPSAGASGLELDTGPQPTRDVPHRELDLGHEGPSGLELEHGPQPARTMPFQERDLSPATTQKLSVYRGSKPAGKIPGVSQPKPKFGEPSLEKAGTFERSGMHFHELNAAEIERGLRVDWDRVAGRPRSVSYRVDADALSQPSATERSFSADISTEGPSRRTLPIQSRDSIKVI